MSLLPKMLPPEECYPSKRAVGCRGPSRPLSTRLLRLIPGDSRSRSAPIKLQSEVAHRFSGRDFALGLCAVFKDNSTKEILLCAGEAGRFRADFFAEFLGHVERVDVVAYALESPKSAKPDGHVSLAGASVIGRGCIGAVNFEVASLGTLSCVLHSEDPCSLVVGKTVWEYLVVTPYQRGHADSNEVCDSDASSSDGSRDGSLITLSSDDIIPVASEADVCKHTPPLFAGHRGLAQCPTTKTTENSIASFMEATEGDLVTHVELDVQVTADGVPVLHHDWVRDGQYVHKIESKGVNEILTLRDVCQKLPADVGLLVDVKFPPPNVQISHGVPVPDHNYMADQILDSLLCQAAEDNAHRSISILCFDADLCTMFYLKQGAIPVCLLHCEELDGPECDDADPRMICVERGLEFARSQGFPGMVLYADLIMADHTLAHRVAAHGMSVMTYGEINTNTETALLQLRNLGVQGLIVDDVVRVSKAVSRELKSEL